METSEKRETDRQTGRQTDRQRQRERQTDRETDRQRDKERERENSELYYSMIKILGSCLFLQSVPANIHASRLHIKQ